MSENTENKITWDNVHDKINSSCGKEIKKIDQKYAKTPCIEHLPDTNYWHYCLQLNTYKAILEEKYGKIITDLYLICLHPENKNKSYLKIKVLDLQPEIKNLFEKSKSPTV